MLTLLTSKTSTQLINPKAEETLLHKLLLTKTMNHWIRPVFFMVELVRIKMWQYHQKGEK